MQVAVLTSSLEMIEPAMAQLAAVPSASRILISISRGSNRNNGKH